MPLKRVPDGVMSLADFSFSWVASNPSSATVLSDTNAGSVSPW
jgi:hypothetical protein